MPRRQVRPTRRRCRWCRLRRLRGRRLLVGARSVIRCKKGRRITTGLDSQRPRIAGGRRRIAGRRVCRRLLIARQRLNRWLRRDGRVGRALSRRDVSPIVLEVGLELVKRVGGAQSLRRFGRTSSRDHGDRHNPRRRVVLPIERAGRRGRAGRRAIGGIGAARSWPLRSRIGVAIPALGICSRRTRQRRTARNRDSACRALVFFGQAGGGPAGPGRPYGRRAVGVRRGHVRIRSRGQGCRHGGRAATRRIPFICAIRGARCASRRRRAWILGRGSG